MKPFFTKDIPKHNLMKVDNNIEKAFLYIDILGFTDLVNNNSEKIQEIFSIIDGLDVHDKDNLKVVVFSDTILVFTMRESLKINYFVRDMVTYTQELFYKLSSIGVFFKAVLTFGEFSFTKMKNIHAYHGKALVETYFDTNSLEGFGLYISNDMASWILGFDSIKLSEKYSFVLLCHSIINLYKETKGILPISSKLLDKPDEYCDYCTLDNDIKFLKTISEIRNSFPVEKVRKKYGFVFNVYKSQLTSFFYQFERHGFNRLAILSKFA